MSEQKEVDMIQEENDIYEGSMEEALPKNTGQNKYDAALSLIEETKRIVNRTDEHMQACKLLLEDDLKAYEEAKSSLFEHSLEKSERLLEEFGEISLEKESGEAYEPFEPKEEIEPFKVQNINRGRLRGFLFSLFFGAATLVALLYIAADKLGTTLGIEQMASFDMLAPLFSWFSEFLTGSDDLYIGLTVVSVVVLGVMAIVYLVCLKIKESSNLKFAAQQLHDAQSYCESKTDCKTKMEKVDKHINERINALNLYQVLLNEQNGKLERIRYIEAEKTMETMHPKSLEEVRDTEDLLETIHMLIETPMSEEGDLSSKSVLVLRRVEEKAEAFIAKFYR